MRHINYLLKPATIDNAKAKDKRHDLTDGGGLALEVMPSGTQSRAPTGPALGRRQQTCAASAMPCAPLHLCMAWTCSSQARRR